VRITLLSLIAAVVAAASSPFAADAVVGRRMVEAVNAFRSDHGLAPVALSETLSAAAQAHADDLAENSLFAHQGSDGGSLADRLARACYPYRSAAENIARGTDTPAGAMVLWIGSEGHRRNLLLPQIRDVGVGHAVEIIADGERRHYWVLNLGTATERRMAGCPPAAEDQRG